MGKSKKQSVQVMEAAGDTPTKKGKRRADEENGSKAHKKQKFSGKLKDQIEDVEMNDASKVTKEKAKSEKKSKKGDSKSKQEVFPAVDVKSSKKAHVEDAKKLAKPALAVAQAKKGKSKVLKKEKSLSDNAGSFLQKKKSQKGKKISSSQAKKVEDSDDSDSSDSDDGKAHDDKQTTANNKSNGKVPALHSKVDGKSSYKKAASSSEEESDSDDEDDMVNKKVAPVGRASVKAPAKKLESSDDEDDSSDSDDEEVTAGTRKSSAQAGSATVKASAKPSSKEMESSSDEESSDEEDEPRQEKALAAGKLIANPSARNNESSEEDDSSNSDEDMPTSKVTSGAKNSNGKALDAKNPSSSEDDEDSDDSEEVKVNEKALAKSGKSMAKPPAKKLESSDDEDESDDSEDSNAEEEKPRKSTEASEDSDGSEDDDDDSDNEAKQNFSSINKAQAEPKTPAIDDGDGSKTVFVKNLAWSVDEDVVRDFFKSAGGIKEVRLAMDSDGRFRGFGHVEFLSAAAAKKACEKSGEVLAGRDIFVDLAKERLFSPGSEGNKDFRSPRGGFSGFGGQKPGSGNTAFVKGFNKFQDEDSIRSSLSEFFDECGIQNIRIPTDRETGHIKGFAYVDFNDKSGLDKAVEYNGSDLDGRSLFIEEAGGGPPSSGGRGRGRGDFGGRGGRGRGNFGGDSGGRGGRGRGNFGDRGRGGGRRGGRGMGGLSGSGKKTTFGDDD
ncbi:hypothetical protein KP509_05G016700 [Ceratopteris richardii]|uniref:RRM domain-containing protein n=2 Tax=Ceratopteris richardii TaxID=49495 RepID=A0A8T2URH5_CERRI|nr:hypothetical protein KP509_05G016700 [Ceratopteris richardii]